MKLLSQRSFAGLALVTILLVECAAARAQDPALASSKSSYQPGEDIVITFANGPGNARDWIGVYPEGIVPDGDPGSTIWSYVDGTQTGATGASSGTITFTGGLATPGKWVAYFLENDGYNVLAQTAFTVADPSSPSVNASLLVAHGMYVTNEPIQISFTNAPGNAKDWVGVYPEGIIPAGDPPSTIWSYVDGSQSGTNGLKRGTITFSSGLTNAGSYVAYLLENDGYNVLASNRFQVVNADEPLLRLDKRIYLTREDIVASFTNAPGNPADWIGIYPAGAVPGGGPLSTIWLYVNGTQSAADPVLSGSVVFSGGLKQPGDWVAYLLENDGYTIRAQEEFTVISRPPDQTNNIILPAPLYLENFDSTPEGELPAGWSVQSYSEVTDTTADLQNLNSLSYANWVVVNAARFTNTFLSYSALTPTDDYRRVLSFNPANIVNGQVVSNLATGNFLFADSGYRDGRSQVLYITTPDFSLSGKTNIYLSFHSLYEQNQDSIGAVEYSIDGGTNWLPVVYMIDRTDIITNENGIDAVATLATQYDDVAYYDDPETGETKGGSYGAFIGAPITQALAPYISGRADDDAVDSKRVELFRLPEADNQTRVRFRLAYAGTDSWYFGVDNFGIYSLSGPSTPPALAVSRSGNSITVSWTGGDGPYRLEKTSTLFPAAWQEVTVPAGAASVTESASGTAAFYRLVDL